MKKFFYLPIMLSLLFISNEINAQLKLGLFGGINYADLKSRDNIIESISRFSGGVLIEYNFNNNLSIVAEPMYLQKGGRQPNSDLNPELFVYVDYLELPVLLKYKFNISDAFQPYIIAGGSVGYRLSAEMRAVIERISFTADLKNLSKNYDIVALMGAGVELTMSGLTFFFEGKYAMGLIDVHENGTFRANGGGTHFDETFTDDNWFKTKGIQIIAGIKFPLGI